ncbi:MAG: hypothetical protein ACFBZ8_02875 [Opitutales bacterium]
MHTPSLLNIRGFVAFGAFSFGVASASAFTVATNFDDAAAIPSGTEFITLTDGPLQATFSGGVRQAFVLGPAYNTSPGAYLIINAGGAGLPGVESQFGSTLASALTTEDANNDVATIDFNIGVEEVSFAVAELGNGGGSTVRFFGVDDSTEIGSLFVAGTADNSASPLAVSAVGDFGGSLIGSIEIDNPGPAANPVYLTSLDTFSASTTIPEPGSTTAIACGFALGLMFLRRRFRRS